MDKQGGEMEVRDVVDYIYSLPISLPYTTTIDIQISYFSGVRSSKS